MIDKETQDEIESARALLKGLNEIFARLGSKGIKVDVEVMAGQVISDPVDTKYVSLKFTKVFSL